jgi:hypothetical protein
VLERVGVLSPPAASGVLLGTVEPGAGQRLTVHDLADTMEPLCVAAYRTAAEKLQRGVSQPWLPTGVLPTGVLPTGAAVRRRVGRRQGCSLQRNSFFTRGPRREGGGVSGESFWREFQETDVIRSAHRRGLGTIQSRSWRA